MSTEACVLPPHTYPVMADLHPRARHRRPPCRSRTPHRLPPGRPRHPPHRDVRHGETYSYAHCCSFLLNKIKQKACVSFIEQILFSAPYPKHKHHCESEKIFSLFFFLPHTLVFVLRSFFIKKAFVAFLVNYACGLYVAPCLLFPPFPPLFRVRNVSPCIARETT